MKCQNLIWGKIIIFHDVCWKFYSECLALRRITALQQYGMCEGKIAISACASTQSDKCLRCYTLWVLRGLLFACTNCLDSHCGDRMHRHIYVFSALLHFNVVFAETRLSSVILSNITHINIPYSCILTYKTKKTMWTPLRRRRTRRLIRVYTVCHYTSSFKHINK